MTGCLRAHVQSAMLCHTALYRDRYDIYVHDS